MKKYIVFFLISFGSFAQSSVSFQLGGTDRTMQRAATRKDVLLHYGSLGLQYGRFLKPTSEVFGSVNFGFEPSSTARYASASAGLRYYLKPLAKRFTPFGQFAGELLLDNSYALTNRDADFIGSAGLGIDFKAASAVSLRGSVSMGLPFFSSGSLSPFTNSGSMINAGIGIVYKIPTATKPVTKPAPAADPVLPLAEPAMALAFEAPKTVPATAAPVDSSVKVAAVPAVVAASVVASVAAVSVGVKSVFDLDSLFNTQIYFKTDKSWVGPESAKKLDRIIELMAEYPEVNIHLKGFTDYRKSHEYNLKLSLKRVQNVRLYLVQHGVEAARFKAEAFSEEAPASTTDLLLNRRVEVRIWR